MPEPRACHRPFVVEVGSLADVHALLSSLSLEPTIYAVRGRLKEGISDQIRRKHLGADATLIEAPHHWLLLDLDKWRADVTDFAARPEHYADQARAELPEAFTNAACVWACTSSAGIKKGVRLRLAFWLDRPLTDGEIKPWVKSWAVPIDSSLYTPSQPHFTAAPLFDGVADPIAQRVGLLEGTPSVTLPNLLLTDVKAGFAAEDALASAARRVTKSEEGDRRNALNRNAYALASRWSEEELPAEKLRAGILAAANKGGFADEKAQRTIDEAIEQGRAKRETDREGWRAQLKRDDKSDAPLTSAANVAIFVRHHQAFEGRLAYDDRNNAIVWTRPAPWHDSAPRTLTAADHTAALVWFQTQCGMSLAGETPVEKALAAVAQDRRFDAIQSYLNGLPKWDGKARVGTFFIRHLGVQNTPLHRRQTEIWFMQAYARAFATDEEPVQADYTIILYGPQGMRKSDLIRGLCPEPRYFRDQLPDLRNKDALIAVAGAWIIELAELTQRKADADVFKAFLTARSLKFRPPYASFEAFHAAKHVSIASTNDPDMLHDTTGNRRFWPMEVTRRAEAGASEAERDQLWAEAAELCATTRPYLDDTMETQAGIVQAAHLEENTFVDVLDRELRKPSGPFRELEPGQAGADGNPQWVTSRQAADWCGVRAGDTRLLGRVKAAMKALGWTEQRKTNKRHWTPPAGWVRPLQVQDRN